MEYQFVLINTKKNHNFSIKKMYYTQYNRKEKYFFSISLISLEKH